MLLLLQAYSGALDASSGRFLMKYDLQGSQSKLGALCHTIGQMPFVTGWATGCPWPKLTATPAVDNQLYM